MIWYSNAAPGVQQPLDGGNIQVRTSTTTTPPTTSPSQIITAAEPVVAPQPVVETLEVKAYPNPSTDQFAIRLESNSKEPITMHVFSEVGRPMEVKYNLIPGQTIQLGSRYRSGTYFVKIIQGKTSKVLRIVKLN